MLNAGELCNDEVLATESGIKVPSTPMSRHDFPGNMRILFGGHLVMSSTNAWFSLTMLFIAFMLGYFMYFIFNDYIRHLPLWLFVTDVVLLAFSVCMACTVAWSDPGILPRKANPRETLRCIGATDYAVEDTISRLVFHEQNPDFLFGKEIIIEGRTVFLKYCGTCELFRPPRSSHCGFCDNCVLEFDHHCPWLSNCIGMRNYRFFVVFLALISITCDKLSIELGFLWSHMMREMSISFGQSIVKLWFLAVLESLLFLVGGLITFMTVYHFVLMAQDLTTSEQVKLTRSGTKRNIHLANDSSGPCDRIARNLFSPRYPRLVPWEHYGKAMNVHGKASESV